MKLMKRIKKFFEDTRGIVSLEYGLGFALIVVVSIGALIALNTSVKNSFYCSSPDQKTKNSDICKDTNK